MMDLPKIEIDPSNASEGEEFITPIPLDQFNQSQTAIKQEEAGSCEEAYGSHKALLPHPALHYESLKDKSSITDHQEEDEDLITPLPNNVDYQAMLYPICQVKLEPESEEEEEDYKRNMNSVKDYPFHIAMKQEFTEKDETNHMETSEFEKDALTDSDLNDMAEEMNKQQDCKKAGNKQLISEQNIRKLCQSSDMGHKCSLCGKVFSTDQECLRHIWDMHTGEKPYICELCGKAFKHNYKLKDHKQVTHSDERPHVCDVCGKAFKVKDKLKQHKVFLHSDERPHSCDLCGKAFKTHYILKQHKSSFHSSENHSCDVCGKIFKTLVALRKHKTSSHSNVRPYSCDVCGKAFKSSNVLRHHKAALHSEERPYVCDICGMAFKISCALIQHKACHSNKRPHSCDICGKTFKRSGGLSDHKSVVHSDERPHSCKFCAKAFKTTRSLKQHSVRCPLRE